MNVNPSLLGIVTLMAALCARGQGTIIFDQQSSTDEAPPGLAAGAPITSFPGSGNGQSFTPSLSSVGLIRLMLDDADGADGLSALVYVNIRSGSITGSIVGTSAAVQLLNGSSAPAIFVFAAPVPVTSGTTYYFEPILQAGGPWDIFGVGNTYSGGSAFSNGQPATGDLWFREGVVVPEPSSIALLMVVVVLSGLHRRTTR